MDRSPPQKFRVAESGDHAKHALLLARSESRLKADEVPHAAAAVLHAELSDRVCIAASARVTQAYRLHRTEAQSFAAAARHLFDRHAALEVRDGIERLALVLIRRDERVEEGLVLLAREW